MTRSEDLNTLGLSAEEAHDQKRIRKAFLRLSRVRHPDKGGTKEGFQKLSEAYYRLRDEDVQARSDDQDKYASSQDEGRSDEGPSWYDYEYQHFWYNEFFSFFRQYSYDSNEEYGYSDEEEQFYDWEQEAYERKKTWSKIHKQQLKAGIDFRDAKAKEASEACVFCGVNEPINKANALGNGIAWKQYLQSTKPRPGKEEGYNTCWVCKTNHKSVITEKMAKNKFAKKLRNSSIFQELRRARYTFTAQPQTSLCPETLTSEYFWYPDLEPAALAAGWKPRGEQKDKVPWQPKHRSLKARTTPSALAVAITPGSSSAKTMKRRRSGDDDKKPSAKRGLKF